MLSTHRPLAATFAVRHPRRQSRSAVRGTVAVSSQKDQEEKGEEGRISLKSRRWTMATMLTATTTLLASSTPTSASASGSSSSSSLCTVDAGEGGKRRLSFFRGLLGSSPEAPCGIEEVLESGRAGGEAFRERRSGEQKRRSEGAFSSSSSSFDERAALEEERERATRDFVESMWQGLE